MKIRLWIIIGFIISLGFTGTAFATHDPNDSLMHTMILPTHCDLQIDVSDYPDLLRDNPVVQIFMERYPEATTTTQIGIAESLPPKAWLPYTYEYGNGTSITLGISVRDCVTEIIEYVFLIEKDGTCDSTNKTHDPDEMITFLDNYTPVIASPYKQLKQGTESEDIQCKENLILIIKSSDNSPACVTHDTKIKLIERGWFYPCLNGRLNEQRSLCIVSSSGIDSGSELESEVVIDEKTVKIEENTSTVTSSVSIDPPSGLSQEERKQLQIQRVLDHCNTIEERTDILIGYENETHHIDNIVCEWQIRK